MRGRTTSRFGRHRAVLAALMLSTATLAGGVVNVATAQETVVTFTVPAGPLGAALVAYGRQAGLQVSHLGSVTAGVNTAGVSGAMSREAALDQLLAGSGLSWSFLDAATVTIDSAAEADVSLDGSIVLEEVNVTALGDEAANGSGYMATPDWVYETPASVSVVSREAIQSDLGARDPRDLLANVAGAYVNNSVSASPAISPNLRGLQDMGRIVISIDGARQNANRTISSGGDDYVSGSGKGFVDTAFIRAVEIDRTTGSTAGLAGSLGGAVTFRTVSADDIIQEGRNWGVETSVTTGTNNQHFQGSILGAAQLTGTPLSVVAGLSRENIGNYQVGSVGTVIWSGADAGETSYMDRDNWSSLLKLEGEFGDVQTSLAWTHQNKVFHWAQGEGNPVGSDELAAIDTVTASIGWDPYDNDLIDLNATLWLNNTREETVRHARGNYPLNGYPETLIEANLLSVGGSLDNTSGFDTPLGALSLNYGVEAFRDTATSTAANEAISAWPELESNFTSFSPAGTRDMASAFANGKLEPAEWITLSAGLRYDWYRLQGSPTYYGRTPASTYAASCAMTEYEYRLAYMPEWDPTTAAPALVRILQGRCGEVYEGTFYRSGTTIAGLSTPESYPGTTLDIDRSDGAWLPSASIELKPVDWFRPYVSYTQSYRPPSIAEAFFTGDLPAVEFPGQQYAPNELLRPETAQTWEVGANVSVDSLFSDRDSLRLKLSAYDRVIEDFIVVGYFYTNETSRQYTGYVNAEGTTRMRGVELEANYDAGNFWVGGSATWIDTEWPETVPGTWYGQETSSNTVQMYAGNAPPTFKGTIDVGVRLMDEALAIGARITHVTPMEQRFASLNVDGEYLANEYTKLDLYGSYQINDSTRMRVGIDNVTDINYVPAGSRFPGPGRTFTLSLNSKF